MDYEPVIGLEIHVQLATRTKLFCGCATTFGLPPNTAVCPTCLGLPGALPAPNREAIVFAVRAGLAFGCTLARQSKFDRKNYFYPDLPKGYQISQFDLPYATGGRVSFEMDDGSVREAQLYRIHLEEDAGKSIHDAASGLSYLDLNRCGTPLLEMVTRPVLAGAREASQCLRAIRELVRWIGVSDGNMEEGSLRCDVNVSVRPRGSTALGTRTEIKNLNSFHYVECAIEAEMRRQVDLIAAGGTVQQETRLWDTEGGRTVAMRSKEEAHDYRYFPEPDLPRLELGGDVIEDEQRRLPELPHARRRRYQEKLGLSAYDAGIVTAERGHADYFEGLVASGLAAKSASNWFQTEVLRYLNEQRLGIDRFPLAAQDVAIVAAAVESGRLSAAAGREVLRESLAGGGTTAALLARRGSQVGEGAELEAWIDAALASDPGAVAKIRAGDTKPCGALTGQVMKLSKGRANPRRVTERILERLRGEGTG